MKQLIILAVICVCCFGAGAVASGTVQRLWHSITARHQVPVGTGINGNNQTNQSLPQTDSQNTQTQSQNTNQQSVNQNAKISVEQAKAIALEKAGLSEEQVYFKKAKLDFDDGRWEYEIEFYKDYVEYDAEIDAQTGTIYKWEMDTN